MTEIEGVIYPQLHMLEMNPQVKGLLTIIRDRDQPRGEFIFYSDRLIRLLVEEGLSYLEFEEKTVITPAGCVYEGTQIKSRICGVSMVRAGESMEAGLRQVCKKIRIGKILISKGEDGVPHLLFAKFPQDIGDRKVLLLDPMLATGASVTEAVKVLMEHGVKEDNILFLNLIAAPQGIKSFTKRFPKITILTVEIDTTLSNTGVSLPGIGEFGDRYFGTEENELRSSIKEN